MDEAWYVVVLNDMRSSNIENLTAWYQSQDLDEVMTWVDEQRTSPYMDGRWGKSFKPGSALEWANDRKDATLNEYWGGIWTHRGPLPDSLIGRLVVMKG